jgi:hypothetical protein
MEGLYTYNSAENIKACSSSKRFYVYNHSLGVNWASSNVWIVSPVHLAHPVLSNHVTAIEISWFVVKCLEYSNWDKTSNNFQTKKALNFCDFYVVYHMTKTGDFLIRIWRWEGSDRTEDIPERQKAVQWFLLRRLLMEMFQESLTQNYSQSILSRFDCFKLSFSVANRNWLWAAFPSESEFSLLMINW